VPHPLGLITLLTDFGDRDWFVASMKGVILSVYPEAHIVDLSHQIAPHRIDEAGYFLKSCYREFPEGTIHVVVVDPGVGSDRRAIAVKSRRYFFLAPDNGALTVLPGSHRREWTHEWRQDGHANGEFNNVITELPTDAPGTAICRLDVGGAIFFSDRLVHGSCPNRVGADRYALISTYHAPAADEEFDLSFSARHVVVPGPVEGVSR